MGAEVQCAGAHGRPREEALWGDGGADSWCAPEAQEHGGRAVGALAGQRHETFSRFLLHSAGEGAQRQARGDDFLDQRRGDVIGKVGGKHGWRQGMVRTE